MKFILTFGSGMVNDTTTQAYRLPICLLEKATLMSNGLICFQFEKFRVYFPCDYDEQVG